MKKEDYFKYYIQGSDHYLIPKDAFDELFNEMVNLTKDTQKYKKVIDKIRKEINEEYSIVGVEVVENRVLKDILKEVE